MITYVLYRRVADSSHNRINVDSPLDHPSGILRRKNKNFTTKIIKEQPATSNIGMLWWLSVTHAAKQHVDSTAPFFAVRLDSLGSILSGNWAFGKAAVQRKGDRYVVARGRTGSGVLSSLWLRAAVAARPRRVSTSAACGRSLSTEWLDRTCATPWSTSRCKLDSAFIAAFPKSNIQCGFVKCGSYPKIGPRLN